MRLIDADALREEAIKAQNREDTNSYINMGLARAVELIANAPTVEQSPVIGEVISFVERDSRPKGKWIEVDNGLVSGRCSLCGWEAVIMETDVCGMSFCPNCGADMRGDV